MCVRASVRVRTHASVCVCIHMCACMWVCTHVLAAEFSWEAGTGHWDEINKTKSPACESRWDLSVYLFMSDGHKSQSENYEPPFRIPGYQTFSVNRSGHTRTHWQKPSSLHPKQIHFLSGGSPGSFAVGGCTLRTLVCNFWSPFSVLSSQGKSPVSHGITWHLNLRYRDCHLACYHLRN